MKKVIRYFGMSLLLVVSGMISSCIKDKFPAEEGSANITINVSEARANEYINSETNIGAEEGIKNMRVIMIDNATREIEYNVKREYNDNSIVKTLTFLGVKPGIKDIYVIANESSIGLSDADYNFNENKLPEDFISKYIEDSSREHFPKMSSEIKEKGLPITGYVKNIQVSKDVNNDISIETYHAVAKISFSFINNTSINIPVTKLLFGKFFENSTYLFKQQSILSTGYCESKTYDVDNTIYSGSYQQVNDNKDMFVLYVYETDSEPNNYTIALQTTETNVSIATPKPFLNSKSILQNNWIQVEAIINQSVQNVQIDFDFSVRPWNERTVEIPSFN